MKSQRKNKSLINRSCLCPWQRWFIFVYVLRVRDNNAYAIKRTKISAWQFNFFWNLLYAAYLSQWHFQLRIIRKSLLLLLQIYLAIIVLMLS